MTEGTRVRWGGAAFVLGVVSFLLSRFRHGHLRLLLHLVGPQAIRHVAGAGFIPVILGTFVLVVGAILFGLDAVRGDVPPRLRAAPLAAGLIGLAWMTFAFDSRPDGNNPEAFLAMRTLFGIG